MFAGFVFSVAAIVLGFIQGIAVSYSLDEGIRIPLEGGLWAVPWIIAAAWFWRRAKGYEAVPLVTLKQQLHYGVFDLVVLIFLLLIPYHYSWAFKAGVRAHLSDLERIAKDEYTLKAAWTDWHNLAVSGAGYDNILNAIKEQPPRLEFLPTFSPPHWSDVAKDFPEVGTWSRSTSVDEDRVSLGINAKNLWADNKPRWGEQVFSIELARLENLLAPLCRQYMAVDLTRYSLAQRSPDAVEIAQLLLRVWEANRAFNDLHSSLAKYTAYNSLEVVAPQLWILFPILLTFLAIPATTTRAYWMAWAMAMTGAFVVMYVSVVFSEFFAYSVTQALFYSVPTCAAGVLVLALTTRRVGKHTVIKMLSVFAPLSLIMVPLFFTNEDIWEWTTAKLALVLLASALTRLMFNRMRSLPEPY